MIAHERKEKRDFGDQAPKLHASSFSLLPPFIAL